jgi:hypothetical protein
MRGQIARHFEQRVTDEENACAKAISRRIDTQVRGQRTLGERDVRSVDERHEVDCAHQRKKPRHRLARGNPMRLSQTMVSGNVGHRCLQRLSCVFLLCPLVACGTGDVEGAGER